MASYLPNGSLRNHLTFEFLSTMSKQKYHHTQQKQNDASPKYNNQGDILSALSMANREDLLRDSMED